MFLLYFRNKGISFVLLMVK